tara:strand:+ start:312 stop:920 length:609 start_codon:yes stop_codon:yes gene_type:complete
MSYRWTEGYLRDSNILDEDEFNSEYNNHKGVINGGLDRDNLPANSIGEDHLKSDAFLSYNLSSEDDLMAQGIGASSSFITFNDRTSGWVHNTAQKTSINAREGMLQVDFCCWFNLEQKSPGRTPGNRWVQMGILLNNNFIAKTGRIWTYAGNVNMSVAVPVASGPQQLHIAWRAQSPESGATMSLASFVYSGGQLLTINRYR